MEIKKSVVLISGGSLGIGKAIAKLLVDLGAEVIITGRNQKTLELAAIETGAFALCADVSKPADVELTFKILMEKFTKLDVLINNAGIGFGRKPIEEIDLEEFYHVFNVNVFGAFLMTQKASKIFKKQNYGNLINIGSTASFDAYEGGGVYVSSKFALRGLTKCWQLELSKSNVRVFLVNPENVTTAWGKMNRLEREENSNELRGKDVASIIVSLLEMDERAFIPDVIVSSLSTFKNNTYLFS